MAEAGLARIKHLKDAHGANPGIRHPRSEYKPEATPTVRWWMLNNNLLPTRPLGHWQKPPLPQTLARQTRCDGITDRNKTMSLTHGLSV